MKLLLDENLSYRMLADLNPAFPGSEHVSRRGLKSADDLLVWQFARKHGFALVTMDSDFHELATLHGAPPKIVGLKCGNRPRWYIVERLLKHRDALLAFDADDEATVAEIG